LLIVFWLIVGVVALFLLFLLVAVARYFRRKRVERKREMEQFEEDVARARQRYEGKDKPVDVPQQFSPVLPFYGAAGNYLQTAPPPVPAVAEMCCLQCGTSVVEGAAFCPNCGYNFASSDTDSRRYPSSTPVPFQNIGITPNTSPATMRPIIEMPSLENSVQPQPQPPVPAPKLQDDPAIQAALQRLWDMAGR
jgi:uncharacterized Zn finger protein (UPF0148 family)